MSSAVLSACCCGGGPPVPSTCCNWWACSPTSTINVTWSGSSTTKREITPSASPQEFTVEEIYWSVTATMTRSGTICTGLGASLFRYTASSCVFSYTRIRRAWSVGGHHTCANWFGGSCCYKEQNGGCITYTGNVPPEPCVPCGDGPACGAGQGFYLSKGVNPCVCWNCSGTDCNDGDVGNFYNPIGCTDCVGPSSPDDLIFRQVQEEQWSFTGTLIGKGSCSTEAFCPMTPFNCSIGNPFNLVPAGKVLTILCTTLCNEVGDLTARPVILFTPVTTGKFLTHSFDTSMDPCCPYPCDLIVQPCYSEDSVELCIKNFLVTGSGNCLTQTTFDEPQNGGCQGWLVPHGGLLDGVNPLNFGGVACAICSPIEVATIEENCIETEENPNGYYCATSYAGAMLPYCSDDPVYVPENFVINYWPDWCEKDTTTREWSWGFTL